LVAEYRLEEDIAGDSAELRNGHVIGGRWST
jgi:hypothetical protein